MRYSSKTGFLFLTFIIFLVERSVSFNYNGKTVVVNVPSQGDFKGRQYQMDDTGDFFVNFFGRIPFAAAPVGDLRFRAPGPAPTWECERDSTYYGPACPQLGSIFYNFSLPSLPIPTSLPIGPPSPFPQSSIMETMIAAEFLKIIAPDQEPPINLPEPIQDIIREIIDNLPIDLERIIGLIRNISQSNLTSSDLLNEDCLYMNIYAPQKKDSAKKYPVMVFIQGGGYNIGTSMYLYDGRVLAERYEVVVVTFNYRLGALGYLSTMDDVSPGNYGMLDQVAAMEWVKENIEYFNGDKDSITIFGESAGASSVGLHLLSPMSEGLFHRAIQQSGSPLNRWAVLVPPYDPLNGTYGLADNIGCPRQPHTELIDCLRTKDPLEISYHTPMNHDTRAFIPVVDGEGGFLPDIPLTLMKNGKFPDVPVMLGYTSDEKSRDMDVFEDPAKGITHEEFIREITNYAKSRAYYSDNPFYEDVANALEYAYTPWEDPEDEMLLRDEYMELLDEKSFDAGIHWQARLGSIAGLDTYVYRFNHPSGLFADWMGAIHTDDLWFTFGTPHMPDKYPFINWTEADIEVTDAVQGLWYNFATTGDPTVTEVPHVEGEWEKFNMSNQKLFHIDHPISKMVDEPIRFNAHAYWMDYEDKVVRSASRESESVCEECPTAPPCETEPPVSAGQRSFLCGIVFCSLLVIAMMNNIIRK
ncbi:bile salt-activated lipase-like isoform X2 [Ptychodera flava]|uniref:bile salt-activated lipase-like isoform X2 n=1 Tax=Ptychodera flava TaxID=63121 RepID=UPI003969BED8